MIDELPKVVIDYRKSIGVPDEIYMFEWCPNCCQVPIKRLEIKIDRLNQEYINAELVQKSFISNIINGFLEPYRNIEKCDCSLNPPEKQLFQAVLCCEKESGRIDKHYYIDFLHNNLQEIEYERIYEFDLNKLDFSKTTIQKENIKKNNLSYYIFIDTETTGLPLNYNVPLTNSQNWPRLVQICWLEYDINGVEISSNDFIIKPNGFQIPISSTKIHNIIHSYAQSYGHDLTTVLSKFLEKANSSSIIVGHNIEFDLNIIGAELYRCNFDNSFSSKRQICTMKATKNLCGIRNNYGLKYPSLQELHKKLFNSPFSGTHSAVADIRATAKCFWELKQQRGFFN